MLVLGVVFSPDDNVTAAIQGIDQPKYIVMLQEIFTAQVKQQLPERLLPADEAPNKFLCEFRSEQCGRIDFCSDHSASAPREHIRNQSIVQVGTQLGALACIEKYQRRACELGAMYWCEGLQIEHAYSPI